MLRACDNSVNVRFRKNGYTHMRMEVAHVGVPSPASRASFVFRLADENAGWARLS